MDESHSDTKIHSNLAMMAFSFPPPPPPPEFNYKTDGYWWANLVSNWFCWKWNDLIHWLISQILPRLGNAALDESQQWIFRIFMRNKCPYLFSFRFIVMFYSVYNNKKKKEKREGSVANGNHSGRRKYHEWNETSQKEMHWFISHTPSGICQPHLDEISIEIVGIVSG